MEMSVSQIIGSGKDKKIYVCFNDGQRNAEGIYPDCKITTNNGFSKEEVSDLEKYMKADEMTIRKLASTVNLWSAFAGEGPKKADPVPGKPRENKTRGPKPMKFRPMPKK